MAGEAAFNLSQAAGDASTTAPDERPDAGRKTAVAADPLARLLAGLRNASHELATARLQRAVAQIDDLLQRQVDAILHHPAFQRLEASWRGLQYLTEEAAGGFHVKVRVLNASWKEIVRDLDQALEFDQSQLFHRIYSDEFGMPGGEPYGLLIADYSIHPRPGPGRPTDDVDALGKLAQIAAAAFAPLAAAAAPSLLGLERFADLDRTLDLRGVFQEVEFVRWRALRKSPDARFVALVMPRVLMRLPYDDDGSRADGFRYREDVSGRDADKYLWGNAVYALAAVVVRAFSETGWLADIRGLEPGVEGAGLVSGLPASRYGVDRRGTWPKAPTDAVVTDLQEKELGELGFLPLCASRETHYAAFHGCQSIQQPPRYDDPAASANARLSSMLHYMLCVSRFAHFIKVICRERVGTYSRSEELESLIQNWLMRYAIASDDASDEVRARYPLREAAVEVKDHPAKPGSHLCVVHLRPHYQLEHLSASLKLVTELTPLRSSSGS